MSTIYAVSSPKTTNTSASADLAGALPMQTLGQQDFLKLLVKKLTTQDPLNPVQDTEFISQMAQFSALEQSKSMQTDMAQMRASAAISQANSFLGHVVKVQTGEAQYEQGVVSAIQIKDGTPKLVISGQAYDLSQVTAVQPNSNRILN